MRKSRILTSIMLLLLLSLMSCTQKKEKQYTFGYQPFGSNYAFFVAMEKGFFTDEGLDVKATKIVSANDAATAMVNGQIIGNATLPLNVLLSLEARQPDNFKIIAFKATSTKVWSDYLLVKKESNISSLKDLANKKVGGYPGSAQQTLIKLILKTELKPDEIKTVEVPPEAQLQALETGQIDALLTYDVTALLALNKGIAKVLIENPVCKYIVDPLYGFPYVLSTKFIKENPKDAKKVVTAMYKAIDYINTNNKESRDIMAKWSGSTTEITSKVNLWDQVKAKDVNPADVQKLADIFFDNNVIEKSVNIAPLIYK